VESRRPPDPDESWLDKVSRLTLDLVTIFDEERLLQRILQTFAEVSRAKKGSLMLPDASGRRLEIRAAIGLSDRARELVRPAPGEGAAGRAWQTGRPLLLQDTTLDRDVYADFYKDPHRSRPKETLLCLPLVYRDEVLGVVNLDRRLEGGSFREKDRDLLTVFCNVAAVALANLKLYRESVTDGLTGLVTQRTFRLRLEEEFHRARKYRTFLSVLFLDVDHFKKFNDTHGHALGDKALKHVADLLREATRAVDAVGRCGGEEFGVILLEADLPSARHVAERIRSRAESSPLQDAGRAYPLTVSVGVAALSPSEKDPTSEALLRRADEALYRAKHAGRNRVEAAPPPPR
jgi:diguanylate cyclase (GGDEF)-like protein